MVFCPFSLFLFSAGILLCILPIYFLAACGCLVLNILCVLPIKNKKKFDFLICFFSIIQHFYLYSSK